MASSGLAAGCAGAETRVLVITHHLLLENLAHAQTFSSFFTHQYFINPRAPSPGGSCGVRNHWVVWRVLPWHPPPSHPASPPPWTWCVRARQGQMGPGTAFHSPECRRSVLARLFLMEDKFESPWWFFIPVFCSFSF